MTGPAGNPATQTPGRSQAGDQSRGQAQLESQIVTANGVFRSKSEFRQDSDGVYVAGDVAMGAEARSKKRGSRNMLSRISLALLLIAGCAASARASDFDTTVESFAGLLGYYTFTTTTQGNSVVNKYTGSLENGASVGGPGSGPPVNDPASSALILANDDGGTEYMVSGGKKPLLGKIATKGSIVAWIDLGDLPSNQNRIFSIAGESSGGDDFDLQIQGNNQLCFFTDGGSSTCDPNAFTAADIGVWHLITATFKSNGKRSLYVDGALVANSTAGGHSANQAPFYVGQSTVFGNRYFVGSIGDVAIYKTTLSKADAKLLWKSASGH